MRRKYMPVLVDCNCDGLWKRAYFFVGLRAIWRVQRGRVWLGLRDQVEVMVRREADYKDSRLRKLIQNWLNCSLGCKRSRAGQSFRGTESTLLHIVMFAGVLFCFRQLLEGLVNVIHGGSSVPAPIAASMFQIVPGSLECSLCGLNFGGHIPLRGTWEKVRGGGYDHQRKNYEGSNFHGFSSGYKRRIDGQKVCDIACRHGNPGFC